MPLTWRTLHYCLLALVLFAVAEKARAHDGYRNWVNRNGQGCCNNTDCAPLPDGAVRTIDGRMHAFIRGKGIATGQSAWCPVLPHHYLKSGNAPDGSSYHACVYAGYGGQTPCEQFICFQPPALY